MLTVYCRMVNFLSGLLNSDRAPLIIVFDLQCWLKRYFTFENTWFGADKVENRMFVLFGRNVSEQDFVLMQSCPGETSVHNLTLDAVMRFSITGVYCQGALLFLMSSDVPVLFNVYICVLAM